MILAWYLMMSSLGREKDSTYSCSTVLYRFFMLTVLTCESGKPGVGKTLTAEAVAERLKRALYSVCSTALRLPSLSNSPDLSWGIACRCSEARSATLSNFQDRQPLERHSSAG